MLTGAGREKLLKLDARNREYEIVVIGEEPYLAYNRVGLTSFFNNRKIENLYLNPQDWVGDLSLSLFLLLWATGPCGCLPLPC